MNSETRKLYEAIVNTVDKPYLLDVKGKSNKTNIPYDYKMCSACYSVINTTWNHATWCDLYKQEPLTKWLQDGKTNKK